METLEIDLLGIYAYADSSLARERDLWRGFLSYSLPIILAFPGHYVDKIISESIVYHLDELVAKGGVDAGIHNSVRCVSTILAKEIGVSTEFALAAFFEGELPTKMIKIKSTPKKKGAKAKEEDTTIAAWLSQLGKIQGDNKFINKVEQWKDWLKPKLEQAS